MEIDDRCVALDSKHCATPSVTAWDSSTFFTPSSRLQSRDCNAPPLPLQCVKICIESSRHFTVSLTPSSISKFELKPIRRTSKDDQDKKLSADIAKPLPLLARYNLGLKSRDLSFPKQLVPSTARKATKHNMRARFPLRRETDKRVTVPANGTSSIQTKNKLLLKLSCSADNGLTSASSRIPHCLEGLEFPDMDEWDEPATVDRPHHPIRLLTMRPISTRNGDMIDQEV